MHTYRTRRGSIRPFARPAAPEPQPARRRLAPSPTTAFVAVVAAGVFALLLVAAGIAGQPYDAYTIGIALIGSAALGCLALAGASILQA